MNSIIYILILLAIWIPCFLALPCLAGLALWLSGASPGTATLVAGLVLLGSVFLLGVLVYGREMPSSPGRRWWRVPEGRRLPRHHGRGPFGGGPPVGSAGGGVPQAPR